MELTVVLVLISLLLLLVPPMFSRGITGANLKTATSQIASGLRRARAQAVFQRKETVLAIDLDERFFRIVGASSAVKLGTDLNLSLVTATSEVLDEGQGAIRFYPDGSSTGGRVTLNAEGKTEQVVDVDWLTGKVTTGS